MKVIIPAAGVGRRMKNVTHNKPKEMLYINGKPVIHYILEELRASGITDICLIIRKEKEDIRLYSLDHFKDIHFTFLYQEQHDGVAAAILLAKEFAGNEPFGVVMADSIALSSVPAFFQLMSAYHTLQKTVCGLFVLSRDRAPAFGNCGHIQGSRLDTHLLKLSGIGDKRPGVFDIQGKQQMLRGAARSIVEPHFFTILEDEKNRFFGKEFDDVPVWQRFIREHEVYGYVLDAVLFDTGNPMGYDTCKEYIKNNFKSQISHFTLRQKHRKEMPKENT